MKELVFVHAWRAGADDAHNIPALLDDFAAQNDGVIEPADEKEKICLRRLRLRDFDRKVLGAGIIGNRLDELKG